jgi:hypothetical protein
MVGFCTGTVTGVGTREVLGVTALEERGLFFDLGLDGAWRKSSGMSFQLSMDGTGVVADGAVEDADVDLGGGGGRLGVGGVGFIVGGCSCCLGGVGFFSQLDMDDCNMFAGCLLRPKFVVDVKNE